MKRYCHAATWMLVCLLLAGCNGATEDATPQTQTPQENHRPGSVAEGVTQLRQIRDTIKAAFESGNPHDCDVALHEGAEVVTTLPDVASQEGRSTEEVNTVATACEQLLEHFMTIHQGFHDGAIEAGSYDTVAEGIDESIASLAALTTETQANPAEEEPTDEPTVE